MRYLLLLALAACGPKGSGTPSPGSGSQKPIGPGYLPTAWPVPAGWKSETIPFPLDFAPGISHRGVEELRFAPGMFDPAAPGYWYYAFVWRTGDAAMLAAPILAAELTAYFRGLLAAVDEKEKRIANIEDITVKVTGAGEGEHRLALSIHLIDAFKTGQPIDLVGWAQRTSCPDNGALWVFVMAPEKTGLRAELDALAAQAGCDQLPLPK